MGAETPVPVRRHHPQCHRDRQRLPLALNREVDLCHAGLEVLHDVDRVANRNGIDRHDAIAAAQPG